MRKAVIVLVVIAALATAGVLYTGCGNGNASPAGNGARAVQGQGAPGGGQGGRPAGGMGGTGGGAGAFSRPPMTVEVARASRAKVTESILVVGNLIGEATVEVGSKVNGRLQSVNVKLGDSVRRGQVLATVEDRELREQVKQAEASFQVSAATIRQRETDLKLADTSLERARSLYERQLIPRQTLDDTDARYQASIAQLDLARAQFEQSKSRLEELRITLAYTQILSPVDGFVGKRNLDPGAFVNSSSSVLSVVDIRVVRLVVNLVERDLRRVQVGASAVTEVDAFPGESFTGRVARVAPVLDPATRTAEMEIEVPNPAFRLKPGMYARVRLTTAERAEALVVPRNALVDFEGKRGVFLFDREKRQATFRGIDVGLQDDKVAEVLAGITEGETVITTGSSGLRDGDPVMLPGGNGGGRPGGGPNGRPGMTGSPSGAPAAPPPGSGRTAG